MIPTIGDIPAVRPGHSVFSTHTSSPQTLRQSAPSTPLVSTLPGIPPIIPFDQRNGSIPLIPNARAQADDKLDLAYLLQSRHNSTGSSQAYSNGRTPSVSSRCNQTPNALSPFQTSHEENRTAHAVQPKTLNQCPLDGLLLKFLSDQRQKAAEGVSTQELIGPPYPCFRALVDVRASEMSHPLSKIFSEMLGKFPDISTLPEQVAIL